MGYPRVTPAGKVCVCPPETAQAYKVRIADPCPRCPTQVAWNANFDGYRAGASCCDTLEPPDDFTLTCSEKCWWTYSWIGACQFFVELTYDEGTNTWRLRLYSGPPANETCFDATLPDAQFSCAAGGTFVDGGNTAIVTPI